MKEKKCGNCKHFFDEDVYGKGSCVNRGRVRSEEYCQYYEPELNGWEEITPDNADELYEVSDRLVVYHDYGFCHEQMDMAARFSETISTMAKLGGYYYYVLPELKIE